MKEMINWLKKVLFKAFFNRIKPSHKPFAATKETQLKQNHIPSDLLPKEFNLLQLGRFNTNLICYQRS